METKKSIKALWKKDSNLVISVAFLIIFNVISLIVLAVLLGTKVLEWQYITGFLLGAFFSITSLWSIRASVKVVGKTQNWLLYMFLFVARLALYFIPLLLAVFLPDVFSVYAVLWGFAPIVVVPLIGTLPAFKDVTSKKTKLLSQAGNN